MNFWFLIRKIHPSWLVAITCAAITVGVFSAQFIWSPLFSSVTCLMLALVLIAVGFWNKKVYIIPLIIFSGLAIGLWRGSISQTELSYYKPLVGKTISLTGSVKDDVDTSTPGQITIRLDSLVIGKRSAPGTLWVTADSNNDIKRGDKLIIHGKFGQGFGSFVGVIYRANIDKIIHPNPGDIARVVRDWFAEGIRAAIPEPEAGLGIGFLVGQKRTLPIDLLTALQLVGLTHIVVASGYNLTILVRVIRRLFEKISKYLSALVSSLMIVSFILVTGVSPSMSRAGLVTSLSLAAWYYGRKFHPIVLLTIAAAVTLILNPSYAWGDLGWGLSFAAFAGVMILAPLGQKYFFGDKKLGLIQQVLGETISAQIATAPIIIMSFGQIPNVAITSNLLVLPFIPIAMFLTFFAGLAGVIAPSIATIVGLPATYLMKYMISVIDFLSNLPWVASKVNLTWWGVGLCYAVIIGICLYMWRVTKYNLRDSNLVE